VRKTGEQLRIAFAAGGTGGHIFPALALAGEFRRRDPRAEIVFYGTKKGLETKLIPSQGYRLHLIEVEALS
jgi:UDP-N-acetylglucosamine--N-acetylmuramyl-(pentapeptide) pyrophosphoryl-undecaprenol N-acetylglucosamine transferase